MGAGLIRIALGAALVVGVAGGGARAAVITETITGTINSFNNGVDSGGYFSAAANTNLTGDTMTINLTYTTQGPGVSYTHDANGSAVVYSAADPGSYVLSWTVGTVTFTEDLSNDGRIDVDHNGSPSRYDIGGNPTGGGFVIQSNINSSTSYYDGILAQPLSGNLTNWSVFVDAAGYPNSTWIALSNVTESGSADVPEPASLALLGGALIALRAIRRRAR